MTQGGRWRVRADAVLCADVARRVSERRARSHLLTGPAGIGRSTVLAAIGERLRERGHPLIGVAGSAALREVPLAAFAPLLAAWPAADPDAAPAERLQRVYDALAPARADQVLLVDDAHLLDAASAAVVTRLVRAYGVRAVLTAPSTHALGDDIARLAEDGVIAVTVLPGLDAVATATTVEAAVGERVDPDDLRALRARTGGNPLHLRELVTAALRAGAVLPGPHGARLSAGTVPARLRRAIAGLYQRLDPATRREAELLAAGGGLPALPERIDQTDALTAAGLLVEEDGGCRLAEPLHAEVLLGLLPASEREERLLAAGERLRGSTDHADRMRGVAVLARTSRPPSTAQLCEAALDAHSRERHRSSVELVELAIRLAGERGERMPAGALLARADALSALGEIEAAEEAFEALLAAEPEDAVLARVASRLGFHHALRRRSPAEGARIAAAAGTRLRDPAAIAYLDANLAKLRFWSGEGVAARDPDADDDVQELNLTLLRLSRSVFTGDLAQARQALDRGRPLAASQRGALPHAGAAVDFAEFLLLVDELRTAQARQHAHEVRAARDDDSAGLWEYALALLAWLRGDLVAAATRAATAVEMLAWRDLLAAQGPAAALHATIAAKAGDVGRARAILAGLSTAQREANVPTLLQAAEADAWIRAAEGDADEAARVAAVAAGRGFATQHDTFAALTALTALRLGRPQAVRRMLQDSPARGRAPVVDVVHDYAQALAARDAAGLLAAAERLAASGLDAAAADAAGQAGDAARAQRSRATARRASALVARLPGAPPATASPLTVRERDVAHAAAERARNREIAERFGISVRTVENHLASAYRKLGVGGRDQLAEALGLSS